MSSQWHGRESDGLSAQAVPTVPGDLVSMLDELALTIVETLRFGVAVVNIARSDGALQVVSVAGHGDARRVLLGHVDTPETWARVLSSCEPWGRLRFEDHRNEQVDATTLSWVPEGVPIDAEDAWHPEDALFAPLTSADGTLLGVLSVDLPHGGRRPDEASRRGLEAFAMAAALAIEHSALRARAEASDRIAQEFATRDQLTGLGNRTLMLQRLEHLASARVGQRMPLALLFIDLDEFKSVNDRHTHAAGDRILQEAAQRIQSAVRPHDTVVRWGGDEFLVLLEQLDDEASGRRVANRITAVIAADPVPYGSELLAVSACLGLAFCPADAELDPDALVRDADTAMYAAKNANRCGDVLPTPVDGSLASG